MTGTEQARPDGEGALRAAVVEAVGLLGDSGAMSLTGHVNFSARIDEERMLLTSHGLVHLVDLESFAVLSMAGGRKSGHLSTSNAEIVGMHTAVYLTRPEAGAVVHTHSPHATAFALAHRPLPCRYEALLRRGQEQEVPVVAWAPRGSEAFVQGIAGALDRHPATQAVLLANHGLLVFGPSPLAAAKLLITLEEAAAAEIRAVGIGGAREFGPGSPSRSGSSR